MRLRNRKRDGMVCVKKKEKKGENNEKKMQKSDKNFKTKSAEDN